MSISRDKHIRCLKIRRNQQEIDNEGKKAAEELKLVKQKIEEMDHKLAKLKQELKRLETRHVLLQAVPPIRLPLVLPMILANFQKIGETQAKINGYSILRQRARDRKTEFQRQLTESELSFAEEERHSIQAGCPWIYRNSFHIDIEIPLDEDPFFERNRKKPKKSPVDPDKPLTQ